MIERRCRHDRRDLPAQVSHNGFITGASCPVAARMAAPYENLIAFWFGYDAPDARARDRRRACWFASDPDFDAVIGERYAALPEQAARGLLEAWTLEPHGRLAIILVLDQLVRNLYRGTARAFAYDGVALAHCRAGLVDGADARLGVAERGFFYMPCQHSEDSTVQARGVALYEALLAQAAPEDADLAAGFLASAREHRDIVARYGRFPHRNAILGRVSSAAELDYLHGRGHSFGQEPRVPAP